MPDLWIGGEVQWKLRWRIKELKKNLHFTVGRDHLVFSSCYSVIFKKKILWLVRVEISLTTPRVIWQCMKSLNDLPFDPRKISKMCLKGCSSIIALFIKKKNLETTERGYRSKTHQRNSRQLLKVMTLFCNGFHSMRGKKRLPRRNIVKFPFC